MMSNQSVKQIFRHRTIRVHMFERVVPLTIAANVRLLIRIELSIDEEAVFKVVDSHLRGFLVRHRTQVPSDLDSSFVRLINGSLQLCPRDVHVRLERRYPPVSPVVDSLPRIIRPTEFV